MNVIITNPEESKQLFTAWGKASSVCYDSNPDEPDKLGKGCMYSGHFSGSRGVYITFLITDVPRFTVDQAVRHTVGTFCNVASFRYINKDGFAYAIPSEIKDNNELLNKYIEHMNNTVELYEDIQKYVYDKTGKQERANESARYVLPMSTSTSFVMGFTIEALIHFCNMRLCARAEDKIQELARLMKAATLEIIPDLKTRLVPNCQNLLYCPEGKKSCGAYPTKKELKEIIQEVISKNNEESL